MYNLVVNPIYAKRGTHLCKGYSIVLLFVNVHIGFNYPKKNKD